MPPRRPGFLRVVVTITRVSAQRFRNRLTSRWRARFGKKKPGGPRLGTARKGGGGSGVLLALMGVFALFYGGMLSFQLYAQVTYQLEFSRFSPPPETPSHTTGDRGDPEARALSLDLLPTFSELLPAQRRELVLCLALVCLGAFFGLLFLNIGTSSDLGSVEWSLPWLFTFPASSRAILFSKWAEYCVVQPYGWVVSLPLLGVFLWLGGYGIAGVGLALLGALFFNAILAALRLWTETWLRKRLDRRRLKNAQAVCAFLGTCAILGLFLLVIRPAGLREVAAALPHWVAGALQWLPPAYPAALCLHPALAVAGMAAAGVLLVSAGLFGCAALVRDGLVKAAGAYQGKRGRAPARRPARFPLRGMVGKEVRLLMRDRGFLVQSIVLPILIIVLQVAINPQFRGMNLSLAAFLIGAYTALFGACTVLVFESKSLWLLYSFPRPLESVLKDKVHLWAFINVALPLCFLAVAGRGSIHTLPQAALALYALGGVLLFTYLASGFGIVTADPMEAEKRRRLRPEMAWLYMLLAGIYAFGIKMGDTWQRTILFVLLGLLVLAVWQKVRDRIPFLLDPTAAPPPRVDLADGLVAVLSYAVLQSLVVLGLTRVLHCTISAAWVFGSAIAGFLVVASTLLILFLKDVPAILRTVGLTGSGGGRALLLGAAAGGAAGLCGVGYLHLVPQVPFLEHWKRSSVELGDTLGFPWLVVLGVVVAPLFEEFLFRGLVFRGLRRSLPRWAAVAASAAVFAIVHPPLSVLPVFVLGIATAWVFDATGLLAASIAAHACYNGIVLFAGR